MRVRWLDEAIELANGDALSAWAANVYTQRVPARRSSAAVRELKGWDGVDQRPADRATKPPGRSAASSSPGLGRELGQEGLKAFQETKHVHIESELAPKDWWYPYD